MKIRHALRSFNAKVVITILTVGILAVSVGLFVTYWIGREHLQRAIGAQFQEMALETSRKLLFLLDHNVEQATLLAMTEDVRSVAEQANEAYTSPPMSEQQVQQRIETIKRLWAQGKDTDRFVRDLLDNSGSRYIQAFINNPVAQFEYYSIIVTDRHGLVVAADSRHRLAYYADQDWWQASFNQGEGSMYISDIEPAEEVSEFQRNFRLGFAVPVMNKAGSEAIGVVRMNIAAKHFFDAVTEVKVGKTDHVMLASSEGALLFCPIFQIRNHSLRPEFMKAIFRDRPGWTLTTTDVHYGGRQSINGFSPVSLSSEIHPSSLGGRQWYIFTSQNPDETYSPINALQNWMIIYGLTGVVALSFFGVYAARFIVRPLQDLQKGARVIGDGNLDYRFHIKTGDEIQQLADEFNEMATKLKGSHSDLEQKVAERTKELAVVNRINQAISSSLDLQLIFEILAKEVSELLDYDLISLALMDVSGEKIQTRMIKAREDPVIVRDAPLRPKTGTAVGFVVDQARPFIRLNLLEPQQFVEDRLALREGIRSYVMVPIVSKQASIGTLNLFSKRSQAYSKRNYEILLPIAEQLAIAIDTIRLFEETKKLDQLKSDFVSKVSHELRTPLTSIKGFTEILLTYDHIDLKAQKEFLGIINKESDRLTRLINDVLDLTRIEAGQAKWQIQPISATDLIDYVVKLFRSLALEKNLPIQVQIPKRIPMVRGDRDQVLQVMDNLLNNAVKFTSSGKITIKVIQEAAFVKVSVSDTGGGISPEDQAKVFDRFYQISGDRTGKPRGTGLGLAICKEIIDSLGGRIWCESELGKGSTFHFTLPVWSDELRYAEPLHKR